MFFVTRLMHGTIVLLLAVVILFTLIRLVPGSPAQAMLPADAPSESIEALNRYLGLDKSVPMQLLIFISNAIRGDLGNSYRHGEPAQKVVLRAAPTTFRLIGFAFFLAALVSLPLGMFSALRPGSLLDNIALVLILIGQCTPVFWSGMILILVFSVSLDWLPTSGSGSWQHFVLPALALSLRQIAVQTRITRVSCLEVLSEPYVMVARSKGLYPRLVYTRHVFPNAAPPILAVMGVEMGYLLGGAVITEVVFGLPGLGTIGVDAIMLRDYTVVQATVLFIAASLVILNLLVDLLHASVDPRIRLS